MISNMYSYFFVHTLHCMSFSVSSRKGRAREDDETVSTGCDAAVPYASDSFCGFSGGPFVLSRGGGGGGGAYWHQAYSFLPLALFWATHRVSCSVTSVVVRWAVLRG